MAIAQTQHTHDMPQFTPRYQVFCLSDRLLTGELEAGLVDASGLSSQKMTLALPATVRKTVIGDLHHDGKEWRLPVLLWVEPLSEALLQHVALAPLEDVVQLADAPLWRNINGHLSRLFGRNHVCAIVGCKESSPRFTPEVQQQAFDVGRMAAAAGFTVLTGGLSGVMSKAAQGAVSAGGSTIGLLPGTDKRDGNPYLGEVLPSGIGIARNYQMALACDVMIALNGGRGTLEEMCFALDFDKPVMSWNSRELDGVDQARTGEDVFRFLLTQKEKRVLALRGERASKHG